LSLKSYRSPWLLVSVAADARRFSGDLWMMNKWFLRILFDLQSVLQNIISWLTSCLQNTSQLSSCQPILCYDPCVCLVDIFPSANRTEYVRTQVCKQNTRSGSGICNIWTVVHIWNTSWNKYILTYLSTAVGLTFGGSTHLHINNT
jgi:hypothetical protein